MKELLESLRIDEERRAAPPAPARRVRWYGAAALVAIAVALASWRLVAARTAEPAVALAAKPVTTAPAPPRSGLNAAGYVRAARVVHVVPRVSGRIARMAVDEGDLVQAGDVVAVLDSRDLEQEELEARAALELADANLARLRAGARPEELAAARARYDGARAEAASAARELGRARSLHASGALAAQALEQAETDERIGAAQLETARQALALLRAGPTRDELKAAGAAVAVARARWTRATGRLEDATVRAPVAGRVIRKFREAGDYVSADVPYVEAAETVAVGSPIVTLADPGPQEVTVDINESDVARVSLAQAVEVTPNAFPGEVVHGSVTRIAPRADRNKNTLEVRVTLEGTPRAYPQDLSVKVRFL